MAQRYTASALPEQTGFSLTLNGAEYPVLNFQGIDQISTLYSFVFQIHTTDSISLDDVMFGVANASATYGQSQIYFNGIVSEITQGYTAQISGTDSNIYHVTVRPTFWQLGLNRRYQTFLQQDALTIIQQILSDADLQVSNQCTVSPEERVFCVQYGESDLDFCCRLMEEEGIFFFFTQDSDGETLNLANSNSVFSKTSRLSINWADVSSSLDQRILNLSITEQCVSSGVNLNDYNPLEPDTDLVAEAGDSDYTVYTWPGKYDEASPGKSRAIQRLQALQWKQCIAKGTSVHPLVFAGSIIAIDKHSTHSGSYVVYNVSHSWQLSQQVSDAQSIKMPKADLVYKNDFEAIPQQTPISPLQNTPKPRIYGTQTAPIVNEGGSEEIWTDMYGRVKVLFPWDEMQQASCWIRVAKLWAMDKWGSIFTPRVGQEVVISFIDGDPDRPLIVGCVYNGDNLPVYLPDEPTKSGIRTNSSLQGDDEYNELRFEDLKGQEQMYLRSEKDFMAYVQNDANWYIINDRVQLINDGHDLQVFSDFEPDLLDVNMRYDDIYLTDMDDVIIMDAPLIDPLATTDFAGIGASNTPYEPDMTYFAPEDIDDLPATDANDDTDNPRHTMIIQDGGVLNKLLGQGDIITKINQGNHKLYIAQGDDNTHIVTGNSGLYIENGDLKYQLANGNMHASIQGSVHSTVQGAVNEEIQDNHRHWVHKDYCIDAQDLLICVRGRVILASSEDISIRSDTNIKLEAKENIYFSANASIECTAKDISMQTSDSIVANAKKNIGIKATKGLICDAEDIDISGSHDVSISANLMMEISGKLMVSISSYGMMHASSLLCTSISGGLLMDISSTIFTNQSSKLMNIASTMVMVE